MKILDVHVVLFYLRLSLSFTIITILEETVLSEPV